MPNLDNLYLRYIQRMEEQMAQKDRKILELEAKVASLEYINICRELHLHSSML